ncbi:hypothetical protein HMPREF0063_12491 [Aeromicrobium marinum DSM 15272]|uniref:Uncharacterized protein n=1 Tax=Aeromicrobium marinum DSM 15272 TaxID=585531 RepID=E2SEN2_9ACTN|nr:hypothetical protein HMPREF0063_12491 [Aeromicrobium marinum DSM 15272]
MFASGSALTVAALPGERGWVFASDELCEERERSEANRGYR